MTFVYNYNVDMTFIFGELRNIFFLRIIMAVQNKSQARAHTQYCIDVL